MPDPPGNFFVLRIGSMKVKAHKEAWPFRSDLQFTGYYEPNLPANSGDCGEYMFRSVNCYDPDGSHIAQYKRSWIEDGDTKVQNFKMKSQSISISDDIVFMLFLNGILGQHQARPRPLHFLTV